MLVANFFFSFFLLIFAILICQKSFFFLIIIVLLWFYFQVVAGDREGLLAKMDIEDQEAFLDNNSPDFKKVSFD